MPRRRAQPAAESAARPEKPTDGIPVPSVSDAEQMRYALDQAAIVAITDVRGRITYANDRFCEISKYRRDELIGQDHRIVNSGYHGPDFMRDLWRTIAQGRIWRGEIRNRAKDGSIYWVDTTIVPFLDADRKPRQYMAIRHDITERRLHEQREREQATLLSLGEMAAVVAHEVRNPLAGIRGGVQLLGSMVSDTSEGNELVGEVVARIDSLNAVITDLLQFARLREAKMAPVDLSSLLDDVVRSIGHDPALAGTSWGLNIPEDLVVDGDVDQLRLVFTNIALNAAQASQGRGRVEVGVVTSVPGACIVVVRDDGPGIPPDLAERVFEPFFTTKHHGTGLGLPTARRIVEAHHGRLELENLEPHGTAVRVVLPAAQRR